MVDQLPWLSKCVRPMLRAARGKKFIGADLSSIEGRTNAWQAGELWKLTAYTMADYGLGPGMYEVTASNITGIPIEQIKPYRQAYGKVPDLACGFQGSVGAFVSMGANYNVKAEDVADIAAQTCAPDVWARTLAKFRPNMAAGLQPHIWTGIKVVVDGWRARHPAIVESWWDHQDAAVEAVSAPGMVITCGKVRYLCSKGFLWCQLPSTRAMAYPQPRVIRQKTIRLTPVKAPALGVAEIHSGPVVEHEGVYYVEEEVWTNVVEVWGLINGQWMPYTLYGGLQVENVSQGIARDVLDVGMKRAERAGYPVVLHAHDELLCEVPMNFGSKEELAGLLSEHTSWTTGLPLAAKGWEDERYVK